MIDKKIIEKVVADTMIDISYDELKIRLDDELKKPSNQQDFDLIDELTLAIIEMGGHSNDVKIDVSEKLNQIYNTANNKKILFRKIPKMVIAACVTFIVIISANVASLSVYGMNIFSTIVEFGKGTINFDFSQQEQQNTIDLPTSIDDPYGLISECQKNGMSPLLPYYIPEGYKLVNIETSNIDGFSKGINFLYKNGNKSINISVDEYEKEVPADFGFPNEDGSLQELQINELTTFVLNEGERYSTAFSKDLTLYGMHTKNVDYDILLKILDSFK